MNKLGITTVGMIALATVAWAAPAGADTDTRSPSTRQKGPPPAVKQVPPDLAVKNLLPDLVVGSATVGMICNPDGTRTAKVSAIVKNQSANGTADLSKIPFHTVLGVDWGFTAGPGNLVKNQAGIKTGAFGGPKALKPGGIWASTVTIPGIPKVADVAKLKKKHPTAQYAFVVTADPLKMVAESNEENNQKSLYLKWDHCGY